MSALDGRPTPLAFVSQFPGAEVEVVCTKCGRPASLRLVSRSSGRGVILSRIPPAQRFYEWEARLRCRLGPKDCGGPGKIRDVTGWKQAIDAFSGPVRPWPSPRGGRKGPRLL